MPIVKAIRTSNAGGNLRYILSGPAHDTSLTNHRVLLTGGRNIDLDYTGNINWAYLSQQYAVTRHKTRKYRLHGEDKRTQAEHLIVSFSDDEFDCSNLSEQANQGMKLVTDWLKERFGPSAQWTIAAQADGKGHRLHYHVSLNSVLIDGKVLDTRKVKTMGKNGMRESLNNYLTNNFEKVTGRHFEPVEPQQRNTADIQSSREKNMKANRSTADSWKDKLKGFIKSAIEKAKDLDDFKNILSGGFGVGVTERNQSTGRIVNGQREKRTAFTYSFTDDDGKTHKSVDFRRLKSGRVRGLGTDFTPDSIQKSIQQRLKSDPTYQAEQVTKSLQQQADDALAELNAIGDEALADYKASQASIVASSAVIPSSVKASVASTARSRVARSARSMQQRRRTREAVASSSVVPTSEQQATLFALSMRARQAQGQFEKENEEVYQKALNAVYRPDVASSASAVPQPQKLTSSASSQSEKSRSTDDDLTL